MYNPACMPCHHWIKRWKLYIKMIRSYQNWTQQNEGDNISMSRSTKEKKYIQNIFGQIRPYILFADTKGQRKECQSDAKPLLRKEKIIDKQFRLKNKCQEFFFFYIDWKKKTMKYA